MKVGLLGLLTLLFTFLKLTGTIAWSWIWVISPLWLGVIVWFMAVFVLLSLFGTMVATAKRW